MFRLRFCLSVFIFLFGAVPTPAQNIVKFGDQAREKSAAGDSEQTERRDWRLKRGAKELSFEFGFAPMQPTFLSGRKEYDTNGRKFALASVRFGRVIGTVKGVTYEYMFGIIPISFALKNEVANPAFRSDGETPNVPKTLRKSTFSVGFQPAAFRFVFLPSRRLKPYVRFGAGFLFSKDPIPVPKSPRYNFIGDFGGGVMYNISERRAVNFGYRYFHISNMNIGEINPGYNANVFYIGYSLFSK